MLGEYCRERRFAQTLTLSDLATLLRANNVSKMVRKLDYFEREGPIDPALLSALVAVLKIDPVVVQNLMGEDEEESLHEWDKWASQWVRPHLITRLIPGVWMHVTIPDEVLSLSDAEAFAIRYAQEEQRLVCLVLSRRISIWVRSGTVVKRVEARPARGRTSQSSFALAVRKV